MLVLKPSKKEAIVLYGEGFGRIVLTFRTSKVDGQLRVLIDAPKEVVIGREDWPEDILRVSGRTTCEVCGRRFFDHPFETSYLDYSGEPFLRIGCDGELYKL